MTSKTLKIGIVLGTRPEIIKNYSIVKALKNNGIDFYVLHTNQQSQYSMHHSLFNELSYNADFVGDSNYSIGKTIEWLNRMISRLSLDLIITNGDTAASLAAAVAAIYSDIGLAHVESGLRSFDSVMIEERNRIMTDAAAHYLFTYTEKEKKYLEQIPDLRGKIFTVGNTTVDFIEDYKDKLEPPSKNGYAYVTMHRKEFTDSKPLMIEVFTTLNKLTKNFEKIIFPMHPRTLNAMKRYGIPINILDRVTVLEPVSAITSMRFQKNAKIVLTDSGCIQEEACIFNTPCVTIRKNTERHATVEIGANIVSGFSQETIIKAVEIQISRSCCQYPEIYGSPGAGQKIVQIISDNYVSIKDF